MGAACACPPDEANLRQRRFRTLQRCRIGIAGELRRAAARPRCTNSVNGAHFPHVYMLGFCLRVLDLRAAPAWPRCDALARISTFQARTGRTTRVRRRVAPKIVIRTSRPAADMSGSGILLDVDNAVQASILLLAAEGGEPVAGPTQMRTMVFLLLKKVGPVAGRGLGGTDEHVRCDSGDVDAELRRLSDAGAVRYGSAGIEATGTGREAAGALGEQLDERAASILSDTKEFYNGMTENEAIVYTRAAYPDAAAEQGEPGRDGQKAVEDVLIGLVGKGVISSSHAARLLRKDLLDVMHMMSAAGIPVFS